MTSIDEPRPWFTAALHPRAISRNADITTTITMEHRLIHPNLILMREIGWLCESQAAGYGTPRSGQKLIQGRLLLPNMCGLETAGKM
jgi:hypothetical protein